MAQFYYKRSVNAPYRDRIPLRIVRAESELSPAEKAYLNAVEKGDYASVKKALEEAEIYFKININCIDPLGRTALLIAIENENLELIELLLSFNVYVGDALLHAIRKEVVGAVELLLNHKKPSGEKQVRIKFYLAPDLQICFCRKMKKIAKIYSSPSTPKKVKINDKFKFSLWCSKHDLDHFHFSLNVFFFTIGYFKQKII